MKNTEDTEQLIIDTQKLLTSITIHWAKKFGLSRADQEDLFGEGSLVLVELCSKYQPEKSTFSTFAYTCINNHFAKYLRKEALHRQKTRDCAHTPLQANKAEQENKTLVNELFAVYGKKLRLKRIRSKIRAEHLQFAEELVCPQFDA